MHVSCENNVALVTGAGSGRGLATATAFAEAGASVVLTGHHEALERMTRFETVGFESSRGSPEEHHQAAR